MATAVVSTTPRGSLFQFSLVLVSLVTVTRLGSSLYLPALTRIQTDLHLSDQALASTMTVYFALFSLAALLAGPAADSRGRRTLVFGGIGLFALGTVMCGLAGGLGLLLGGRALQALGGSALPVVTRAMVRDACNDEEMVQVLGWMGVLNSLAPIVAPVLGGLITEMAGWRANFHVLLAMTALLALWSWSRVPETLPPERRTPLELGFILGQYRRMILSPLCLGVLLPILFCFALQGAYLALAPFTFVRRLGLSPVEFGLTNLPLLVGLILGRSLCVRLLRRYNAPTAYAVSGAVVFLGGLMCLGVYVSGEESVLLLLVPTFVFCLGFGSLLPVALTTVMKAFQEVGGTVSALQTSLMLAASAVGSAAGGMALHHTDEFRVLILSTALCGPFVAATSWWARRWIPSGAPSPGPEA